MPSQAESLTADQLLLERLRQGDPQAFRELVELHWDRIFSRVFQLLRNHEDAEEITQDTFLRAQRGLDHFRGDASLSTWLYQIATNLAHNRYWYWWRRKRGASFSIDQPLSESGATLADLLAVDAEDPAEESALGELSQRVAEAMPRLNRKHRDILELRLVQNLSYEEIAQKLRINVGTVKSRIARARECLRQELGDEL